MRRIIGLETLTEPLSRSVVTIGKFFAVHRGHQALLRTTREEATRLGAQSVVFTFDRHPGEVLQPGFTDPLLTTLEERLDLIAAEGIDVAVVAVLTPDFLGQEPEAFVRDVLVGRLGAVEVLASEAFRFGKAARGDFELLRALGPKLGFTAVSLPPVLEGDEWISSTRVAECVRAGEVAAVERLLGRPYAVAGSVQTGDQVGRQLGFPTANVAVDPARLLPADGVYTTRLSWDGGSQPAVANLGVRPTRDGHRRLLEVHLLDWTGDLYGREVRVEFCDRLRAEQRFPDLNALKAQIARDVEAARAYFAARG